MKKINYQIVFLLLMTLFLQKASAKNYWSVMPETNELKQSERIIVPEQYKVYALDVKALMDLVQQAPMEFSSQAHNQAVVISLPIPDGSFMDFAIVKSPIMEEGLAIKFPSLQTFSGVSTTNSSAWVRFDFTQFGFHAMMRIGNDDVFIDPYHKNTTSDYLVYYKKDFVARNKSFQCGLDNDAEMSRISSSLSPSSLHRSIAGTLRTYRLALACTGEYAAYHGGTTAGALSAMVTSVNRVTGVYESELDIRLNLISNNDTLIFLNANSDPYDNNDGGAMLGQNQTTITARIGSANYDIGHVYSTGGGGIANLGCVCNNNDKAEGVTGSSSPIGDPFDIDYVAHEMGHQFGGNHTFNSVTGGCQGNRVGSAAYEPGSGVTIMAYAGLCNGDNLANNSIAYFHTKSFDEIVNYTTLSTGNSCPVQSATGNNAPVMSPGVTYNVPVGTAFKLIGSGTDPDGDTLSYSWEEFDLGAGGAWNAATGNAPIYRTYAPSVSPLRYFPKLSVVLSGVNAKGESYTSYARTLKFRLIGRDNKLNGGGVTYSDTVTTVNVLSTSAPFAITYPNITGITWSVGSTETITWDAGGTDLAPFNEQFVNIFLSTNAGSTFPVVIAMGVANSGSYTFTVPNNQSTTCRVWVEGASSGSIFFDINNKNFTISGFVGAEELTEGSENIIIFPNPAKHQIQIHFNKELSGNADVSIYDVTGQLVKNNVYNRKTSGNTEVIDIASLASGIYLVKIKDGEALVVKKLIVE